MTPHETLPYTALSRLRDEQLEVNYVNMWGYSGFLYKKSININQNKHVYRQRWTICHELGHYINGDRQTLIGVKFYHCEQEKRADEYAMKVLLPLDKLIEKAKVYKWTL